MFALLTVLALALMPDTNPAHHATRSRDYYARRYQHNVKARQVPAHKTHHPKRY